jgi:hypothetical protein
MLRCSFFLSLAVAVSIPFLINEAQAQELAPGKLVQIRQAPEYPFELSSLDSLIGREYVLVSTTLRNPDFGRKGLRKNIDTIYSDTNSLSSKFAQQPDPDTLLSPWIGKKFRIIGFQQDTSFGGFLKDWYLQAKFSENFTVILKVLARDLQGDGSRIVSQDILDSARGRWLGKYLWINVRSDEPSLHAFTRVIVLSIEPVYKIGGPFSFHFVSDQNDTDVIDCKIQPPSDTSRFPIDFGKSFGKEFLEQPPSTSWKTVSGAAFDHDGIALGQKDKIFFQRMKSLGVRTHSRNITYSMSGEDSTSSAELQGKGIWGMPFDTCSATFTGGKLSGLSFSIYDTASEASIRSELIRRFGEPSLSDTIRGMFGLPNTIAQTWMYYSSKHELQQILLVDMQAIFTAFSALSKVMVKDGSAMPVMRATLMLAGGSTKPDQTGGLR